MQWRYEKTKVKDRSSRFRAQKNKLHPLRPVSLHVLYVSCISNFTND
jgi:hypothetical protein